MACNGAQYVPIRLPINNFLCLKENGNYYYVIFIHLMFFHKNMYYHYSKQDILLYVY